NRLDDKLQRLHQELKILEDRQALEGRERALQNSRPATTLDQLREKLRASEFTADEADSRLRELATQRRQASTDRTSLTSQLDALRAQNDTAADRVVDLEERLATKSEELRALAFERES